MEFVCDNPRCPLHIPLACVDPMELMKSMAPLPDEKSIMATLQMAGATQVMHGSSFKDPNWPPGLAQSNALELDFDIIRLRYAPRQIGYTTFKFDHQGMPVEGRLCTVCVGAVKLLLGV